MSLESFSGFDSGEPMSEASFEKLRERMKAAAAQIKAIKKEEKKQKKKEDELFRILLQFIKTSHKTDLILLISRVLEQNVPANFIMAIILLGNEEIQQAMGNFLMLNDGGAQPDERALVFFNPEDKSLPLKLKAEMDNWIKNMLSQADENPQKLMKTGYDIHKTELECEFEFDEPEYKEEKVAKEAIVKLITFVLRSFLESHNQDEPYKKLKEFSLFILTGILSKTAEGLKNRKLLAD